MKAARGVNLGVIYPTIVDYTLKPRIESYVEKLCKESEREQSPIGLAALFLVGRTADEEIKKHAGLSVAKIIHEFAAGLYSLSGPQVEEAAEIFIGTVFHSFSIGLIVASSRAAKEVRELAVNNFFRSLPSKVTGDIFAAETDQAPAFALGRE